LSGSLDAGSYRPSVSRVRPSRGERESATEMRKHERLRRPVRFMRMTTGIFEQYGVSGGCDRQIYAPLKAPFSGAWEHGEASPEASREAQPRKRAQ